MTYVYSTYDTPVRSVSTLMLLPARGEHSHIASIAVERIVRHQMIRLDKPVQTDCDIAKSFPNVKRTDGWNMATELWHIHVSRCLCHDKGGGFRSCYLYVLVSWVHAPRDDGDNPTIQICRKYA